MKNQCKMLFVVCMVSIATLLGTQTLLAQDIDSNLVGRWNFEEGTGTVAVDSSGQGHDAEFFTGDPQWVPGISGTALEFDGDDALFTPTWYGVEGFTPRTIMCWIKSDATNTHGILSWGFSSENGRKYHFRINNNAGNGTVGAIRTEIQGTFNIASTIVNDNEWHHIVSIFPEDGLFVIDIQHYVDGVLEEMSGTNDNAETIALDTAASPDVSDQEFRIGMSVQGTEQRLFPGIIDEVRVYERALTSEEVQLIYELERDSGSNVNDFMIY